MYKNGNLKNDVSNLTVFDDKRIDGKIVEVHLRSQTFSVGDSVRVEMLSIDQKAFDYFSALRDLANPISNFS